LLQEPLCVEACSNEAEWFVQIHPKLFDATGWPPLNTILDDVAFSWLKIFIQHQSCNIVGPTTLINHATLLAQQYWTMVVSFEQAFGKSRTYVLGYLFDTRMTVNDSRLH
jgi:hypothetical protein